MQNDIRDYKIFENSLNYLIVLKRCRKLRFMLSSMKQKASEAIASQIFTDET